MTSRNENRYVQIKGVNLYKQCAMIPFDFLFKQKYKLSSTVLKFSCLSYSACDIPASNKNDNLWKDSIKILRLPSTSSISQWNDSSFKISFHSEPPCLTFLKSMATENIKTGWEAWKELLRLQMSTEMICTHEQLGRSSKVRREDSL